MSITVFKPVTTEAGKAAAINANATGVQVAITAVSFGTGVYEPTGYEEALSSEVKRVSIAAGSIVADNQARITAVWESDTDNFPIHEVGFWAGDVLFSVWSRSSGVPLGYKTPGADFILMNDLKFVGIPSDSVTIQVDSSGVSAAIAMMANHEAASDPHPGYVKKSLFPNAQALLGCTTGGSANVITLASAGGVSVTSYTKFQKFSFIAAYGNTGAVTVNVDGVGAVAVKKNGTADLATGDIVAGAVYELIHDGTNFQIAGGMGGGGAGAVRIYTYTPSAGQTIFTGADDNNAVLAYTVGAVQVFRNGANISDYTATDGTSVVLATGAAETEEIKIVAYTTSTFADSVKRTGDSMDGPLALYAGSTVPLMGLYDKTAKVANMEAVRRERGSYSSVHTVVTNATLSSTHDGALVLANGAASIVITLPVIPASMPAGTRIEVQNISAYAVTVSKSGSDTISVRASAPLTAVTVRPGDTAIFTKRADGLWVMSGSAADRYTQSGEAQIGQTGYQRLHSGLIMQWGITAALATDSELNVTFPLEFPTAVLNITTSHVISASNTTREISTCSIKSGYTKSGFTLIQDTYGDKAVNEMWQAIGY